ncbi:uncharacterized protein LOC110987336 [Acanthaster planci]|uniref:Uncharacterized protein LOC110987336 n=1 Tax=Acanthaster planci TaxID=133434 RepID=A0A8B7ZKW4_ACAPL|nr:uncharacterized protein LOC110987336 [Acanthaster planci]
MKTFIFSVILVSVLSTYDADGRCYDCTLTSIGDIQEGQQSCGNPFDGWGIQTVPCTGPCKTIYSEIQEDADVPPITVTIRSCHDEDLEGVPCVDLDNFEWEGMTLSQSCCLGELCNDNELGGDCGDEASGEWGYGDSVDSETGSDWPGDEHTAMMMSIQMKVKCQLAGYSDPLQCTFASD